MIPRFKSLGTVTFVNVTGAGSSPSTDKTFDVAVYDSVILQVNTLSQTLGTSDDFDIGVISSVDSVTFDETDNYYAAWTFASSTTVATKVMTVGVPYIKIRADENGSDRVDAIVEVFVRG